MDKGAEEERKRERQREHTVLKDRQPHALLDHGELGIGIPDGHLCLLLQVPINPHPWRLLSWLPECHSLVMVTQLYVCALSNSK